MYIKYKYSSSIGKNTDLPEIVKLFFIKDSLRVISQHDFADCLIYFLQLLNLPEMNDLRKLIKNSDGILNAKATEISVKITEPEIPDKIREYFNDLIQNTPSYKFSGAVDEFHELMLEIAIESSYRKGSSENISIEDSSSSDIAHRLKFYADELSISELTKLVEELEYRFIKNPLVATVLMSKTDANQSDNNKKTFSVEITTSPGEKKIYVIKEIGKLTGMGLKDAKTIVETTKQVKDGLSKEEEAISKELNKVGATCEIKISR